MTQSFSCEMGWGEDLVKEDMRRDPGALGPAQQCLQNSPRHFPGRELPLALSPGHVWASEASRVLAGPRVPDLERHGTADAENPCVVVALPSTAQEQQTLFLARVPSRGERSVSLVRREGGNAGFNPEGPGSHKS